MPYDECATSFCTVSFYSLLIKVKLEPKLEQLIVAMHPHNLSGSICLVLHHCKTTRVASNRFRELQCIVALIMYVRV